jgi:hypothetical protein
MALQNAFENLALESKQLPNNHDVTVSNQPDQPLTDAQLRATPVPVSGTVSATIDTTGLATSANQQTDALTDVELRATPITVDGTITEANSAAIKTAIEALDNAISGSEMQVDVVAPLPAGNNNIGEVNVASSVLPTGAATAAKQLPDNHNVVVTSAPTTAVTGTFWQATQPVSGTVTANTGLTQPLTDTQLRATAVPVSGTVTANLSATDNAVLDQIELNQDAQTALLTDIESNQLPDGHNVTVDNASLVVTGTFWQATQPVSAATLPLPAGAATEAKQDDIISALDNPTYKTQLDDTSTANVTYIGKALPGSATSASVWQVSKMDETTGLVITFKNGSASFNTAWDDRLTGSYS